MISKQSFTQEHINSMRTKYPRLDKQLIERTIFALGLLEALIKVKLPFIFKGGTALMLLLTRPYRLSTDIDIIVDPSCDINEYLKAVSEIYPFIHMEESIRMGKNEIIKKHYKFFYKSPLSDSEIPILLDVLFEKNGYEKIIPKEIKNEFLLTEGESIYVDLPSIESILGDKLTAFAPNTTGIEYEYVNSQGNKVEKTLEVMKQFLDVSQLIKEVVHFSEVVNTYQKIVSNEIKYRGIDVTPNGCLMDSFNTALSIFTRGGFNKAEYIHLLAGIRKIQNHIIGLDFSGETAYLYANTVMVFVAKMLKNNENIEFTEQELFVDSMYKAVNSIRRLNKEVFDSAATAIRLVHYGEQQK